MGAAEPLDAIAAATAPDPYGFYARLVAERPLAFDPSLGLWVAAGANAVRAVLTSPACRVRPPAEPVPTALLGSPAEGLFRGLARMNDGAAHAGARRAATALVDAFAPARVDTASARCAERLARDLDPARTIDRLGELAFALPSHVIGTLLGIEDSALGALTQDVSALVRCLFPGGSAREVEAGKRAASALLERFGDPSRGADPTPAVVNAIGLLAQAHDATGGLVCATLLALARDPARRERIEAAPERLRRLVVEVSRFDPPIQNTRRFVAAPVTIADRALQPGDAVLVVLAAANRDPGASAEAQRFAPDRDGLPSFSFGTGAHACPGRDLAVTMATAGVSRLLAAGLAPERLGIAPAYRPSPNARLPILRERTA